MLSLIFLAGFSTSAGWGQAAQREQEPQPQPKLNRLAGESSPYLLQHASNPVDWYPWGEEAFARARSEDKPIFLSIGYSTCHWCHVMERESFSNPRIAEAMNRGFVCVKVDREERPDIDRVYMSFVQASTGGGGWPMSVFLTPDLKPFFGGTYYPPRDMSGRPGFPSVLRKVSEEWRDNREAILSAADRITDALRRMAAVTAEGQASPLGSELLARTYAAFESSYDAELGGFGRAPKFPRPSIYNFLLRHYRRTGESKALGMTVRSLRAMSDGGIHDQLGGGFHRYSTDRQWFLPHFEKMLYDQAQLAIAYLDAFQLSQDPSLALTARATLDYVLRDLTGPRGGFQSAEDADSAIAGEHSEEHAEGAFYVWSKAQIDEVLGNDAGLFSRFYGVQAQGNVKQDPFGEFKGRNVLFHAADLSTLAKEAGLEIEEARRRLEKARAKLLQARSRRPRPLLDDKVLTAWNGLMISAFARAYQVLGERRYLEAATRAAEFVTSNLYDPRSRSLLRRYREGRAAIGGKHSDYAFLIQGLIDLYETSLEGRWLQMALDLTDTQNRLFLDSEGGGFFNTDGKDDSVLFRLKESYDGAEPSPNSVAALNLLRLGHAGGRREWIGLATKTIQAFRERIDRNPEALPQMMAAVDFHISKPRQIVIAGDRSDSLTQKLLQEVHKRFIPGKILLLADGGRAFRRLAEKAPALAAMGPRQGKSTAYVCRNFVCDLPTSDPSQLGKLLELPAKEVHGDSGSGER